MNTQSTVRVAVAQGAIGNDLDENLATCLRLLETASADRPDLVVLPEFCNHLSWYEDQAHCHQVSLELDGEFLSGFAAAVARHGVHAVINVTLRGDGDAATGTSILYGPDGQCLGTSDKQVLIGHENDFLDRATQASPIVETPVGRLGLYACMDGVINETPRCLALRGGQILCNSLNSFASDEGSLHIPVRAAENRVFVAAANKVGPLIPPFLLGPVSEATGIPERFLHGAGESQVVAPDGMVLAMASTDQEQVVWADIDPSQADLKQFGDGTSLLEARRPALYTAIAQDPAGQPVPHTVGHDSVPVAMFEPTGNGAAALDEACTVLVGLRLEQAHLLALPELLGQVADPGADPAAALAESDEVIRRLRTACDPGQYVSTSVVMPLGDRLTLAAVLIGAEGVVLRQNLVHVSAAHPWASTDDEFQHAELPFGRVAVVAGPDSRYPETFRMLALAGTEIAAVPLSPAEAWETSTGLVERAAENRINLLVAATPGQNGTGFIASLQGDFTVLTPWKERPFDGILSAPPLTRPEAAGHLAVALVHPQHSANKVVSRGTDLLRGRPWHLAEPIVQA